MAVKSMEPIWFTPPPVRGRYPQGLWKDSPSTPQAPDPVATAAAQGTANIDAARVTTRLNRYDQNTPLGSLTWTQGGAGSKFNQSGYDAAMKAYQTDLDNWSSSNAQAQQQAQQNNGDDGWSPGWSPDYGAINQTTARPDMPDQQSFWENYDPDKWTSTTTLDPRVQQLLDDQLATSQGLSGATSKALQAVDQTFSTPLSAEGLPELTGYNSLLERARGNFTDPQADLNRAQGVAGLAGGLSGEQIARLRQTYGKDFNYNGAPAMPTANEATRKAVEDALYSRSTARLDPRYQQAGSDLESRLAAQGITQGSEAYNREQGNLGMNRNDAYQSAMNDAVSGSTNAMQQLFNMGMGARQQGVTEANTMRAMPTQEALAAANLNAVAGQDLRGYYGTELAQEQAIPNIAGAQFQAEASQRAQALSEQTQIRNQIMNELNALRTGSQVSMPNFSAQGGGATVGAAPVAQSAYNSYQGDVNSYNAAVGSNNSMMSGLMNLGGSAMMAPAGTFSGLASMF